MRSLFQSAAQAPFISLVEIVEVTSNYITVPGSRFTAVYAVRVKPVSLVRGEAPADEFTVANEDSPCGYAQEIHAGETYFVAGTFIDGILWSGPLVDGPWGHLWR